MIAKWVMNLSQQEKAQNLRQNQEINQEKLLLSESEEIYLI